MTDLAKNMRAYLLSQPAVTALVGSRVYANVVPQDAASPYIFFTREGTSPRECLDLPKGTPPMSEAFTIEAWCEGVAANETMYPDPGGLLPALRGALSEHSGTFGDTSVKHVELEDNSDDYLPKGAFSDLMEGWLMASFSLEIYERHGS